MRRRRKRKEERKEEEKALRVKVSLCAFLADGVEGMLGIHWRTRAIAPQLSALSQVAWNISLNSIDFWRSYCAVEFGSVAVGDAAAAIFSSVDSFALPRPVGWISGPGNLIPDFLSWYEKMLSHHDVITDIFPP